MQTSRRFTTRAPAIAAALTLLVIAAEATRADTPLDSLHARTRFALSAGWALGSAGDALNPAAENPDNEKFDASPLIHLEGLIGGLATPNVNVKLILGNFGRLVNRAGITEFSAESSGTEVRRAVIADLTLRTPLLFGWSTAGARTAGVSIAINSGFIFDAQQDQETEEVLDAASYLFAGPTVTGVLGPGAGMQADLLFGRSEILTGREPFGGGGNHPTRFRPRLRFAFDTGDRTFVVGFWGDLGFDDEHADAITTFIATPILPRED